jgi:hypothetical protein
MSPLGSETTLCKFTAPPGYDWFCAAVKEEMTGGKFPVGAVGVVGAWSATLTQATGKIRLTTIKSIAACNILLLFNSNLLQYLFMYYGANDISKVRSGHST